ncbi:MAG: CDGSH iron-sulfur domain-containing protein [Balneolaceae bacterium]|nr:CDGSH iron-sulfur domain-containing protein [Balneolaceae bacterium]
MKSKIHNYKSEELQVHYDVARCIHAAECVKGLRKVFDPKKRPWIQPEQAEARRIASIVTRCPTGALHYTTGPEIEAEQPPPKNSIAVSPDGPLYLRGRIRVEDHNGELLLEDTRLALCRCGQSANKPLCDGSHSEAAFEASSAYVTEGLEEGGSEGDGPLTVKVMEHGPCIVEGNWLIYSETMQPRDCSGRKAMCRCGASANKPFCDGSHKEIGFRGGGGQDGEAD